MNMAELHIVVQAGGRGSRLRHHTWNKPKCLVSVRGKPLLYHLFDRFKGARFTVIGDYCYEQLERYMVVNPPGVTYTLVKASGTGTASGIAQALTGISDDSPLLLIWSDLIIGEIPDWPKTDKPVIYMTNAFTCRWSVAEDGKLIDQPSSSRGIPGLFYFPRKALLPTPPFSGEFVRWLSTNLGQHETLMCPDMKELGDFSSIETENDAAGFSRFFNRVIVGEDTVEKVAIDPSYAHLIDNELHWYSEVHKLGFRRIPKLLRTAPMTMERIHGEHVYRISDLTKREQHAVFADYLDALNSLHDMGKTPSNRQDVFDVYHEKTVSRVSSVSSLIPGFERKSVTVNGRKCRNVFHPNYVDELKSMVEGLVPHTFTVTHGDATFSNTLVDDKLRVWFIDPRGYFSKVGIMGDPWYDFAKVYYSAVGGYDAFNHRKFKLHIDDETVEVLMQEPMYAQTAENVFNHYFGSDMARIRIIHGLIWLALSGYAKDDIDSVIGSFYLGLYWLEGGSK